MPPLFGLKHSHSISSTESSDNHTKQQETTSSVWNILLSTDQPYTDVKPVNFDERNDDMLMDPDNPAARVVVVSPTV